MTTRKFALAAAAATMAVAPLSAQSAPVQRTSAPVTEENELGRNFLWIIVAIAIGIGLYFLLDGDDSVSP